MPTISEFFGILIRMYWDDHPPPHFHALYAEHEAQYTSPLWMSITDRCRAVRMRTWSNGPRYTKMS